MLSRAILISFSILGIVSIFLPWLYFPSADKSFYGYRADGVVTGFLFSIVLFSILYNFKKPQINNYLLGTFALIGILLSYIIYRKIIGIEIERENFTHDNVMVVQALAGTQLGIGVYLSGFAGLGVLFTSLVLYFNQKFKVNEKVENLDSKMKVKVSVILFLILSGLSYAYYIYNNPSFNEEKIKSSIVVNFNNMGQALKQGEYKKFVEYNHPTLVTATGGKAKLEQAVKEGVIGLSMNGVTLKDIKLMSFKEIKKDGREIQAVITQELVYNNNNTETKDLQNMLAVSNDMGKNFKFINITNKSKEEVIKFFPQLNRSLNF